MPLNESVYRKKQREDEERRKREQAVEIARGGNATGSQNGSNSNSTNSSTTSQKSPYGSQRVSNEPSKVSGQFESTARKYTRENFDDRSSGRYRTQRRKNSSYIDNRGNENNGSDKKDTHRVKDTLTGAGKQWLGGQLSSIGTTGQSLLTDVESIHRAKAVDDNPYYDLRSRENALGRETSAMDRLNRKEGVDIANADRAYDLHRDENKYSADYRKFLSGTENAIRKGDTLQESGAQDIERAKEGANGFQKFLIEQGSQLTQWGMDAGLSAIPVIGQALSIASFMNRAGGMASYQARQEGMNADQQFFYQQGSALAEGLSELTFQSVGALRATYGKGIFSIGDKLVNRASVSGIVNRLGRTELGKSLFVNMARLGGGALEEGLEEVETDLVDPLLKYMIKKSADPNAEFEGWDIKQMGYDFLMGATMGGVLGGVDIPRQVKADLHIVNDDAYNEGYTESLIKQASIQGRQGEGGRTLLSNSEILAEQFQKQIDSGKPLQPAQIRMLQEAIGQSIAKNEEQLTRRKTEEYTKAEKSGNLVQMQGTRMESEGIDNASQKLVVEATEKAKSVIGENATEEEAEAVASVTTGIASASDIDTVLAKPELKKAVETIMNEGNTTPENAVSIPINNAEARDTLENLTAVNRIANRNTILKGVQEKNAETIKASIDGMSESGKDLFASRADEAQKVIGSADIYRDRFSRLYTDGNTKGADFETSYNRIIGSLDSEALKSVFTKDFAKQIFDEGKKAIITNNAKESARSKAEEYANRKGGLTFENNDENLISAREKDSLQKFAERVGVEINVVKTLAKDANGKALMSKTGKKLVVNGKYQNGVITIASDAQNKLITVAKHELTHHLKETSPEMYQKLEDFVFERWYHGNAEEMEDEIARYMKLYSGQGLDRDGVREEIIADASEAFFTDEGAIQDAISFSEKLGRAIHDGIKTMLDAFLGLQDSDSRRTRGYGNFLRDLGILQEAERMWLEALEDSQQKKRNAKGGTQTKATTESEAKNSLSDEDFIVKDGTARWTDKRIRRLMDQEGGMGNYSSAYAVLMNPRDYLKLTLSDDILDKWNKGANTPDHPETRSLDREKLEKEGQTPYLRIYSKDGTMIQGHEGRHRMRALMEAGVKSVPVVLVDTDTKYSKAPVDSMTLSSQDFGYDPVNNNAKVTIKDLVPIRGDNFEELQEKFGGEADVKFSVSAEDQTYLDAVNRGDMETAQRMVDERARQRGYDIKAYHGTGQKFTRFDRSKQGSNYDEYLKYGNGFYFATTEKDAKFWGNLGRRYGGDDVMSVYLKADRMLDVDKEAPDWAENFLIENGYNQFEASFITLNSDRFLKTLLEGLHMSNQEVQDLLISKGYDGIKELYGDGTGQLVVFYPVQIKSADPVTYDDNGEVIPLSKRFTELTDDIRYSVSEDSDGNKLSKGQQEFFGNSKIVDSKGNLKVMYHGSPNIFDTFDIKKAKSGLYGRGFYFTEDKSRASQYGKTYGVYLDIEIPLQTGTHSITKPQLKNFIKVLAEDENYGIENYGYGATVDSVLKSVWGKDDFAMLQDLNASAVGDFAEAVKLFNKVNGTSYDGIVAPTETIAFYPEQIKETSNKKPTKNPNMKFSVTEPVEETKDLIAVHNLKAEDLRRALDLGGFPMPSIAIIKADAGHNAYGEYSAVFDKSTIDPSVTKKNVVYGGDAWTPTFPRMQYKANDRVSKKISQLYYDRSRDLGYETMRPLQRLANEPNEELDSVGGEAELKEAYKKNKKMMRMFLRMNNNDVEDVVNRTEDSLSDVEIRRSQHFIDALGEDAIREFEGKNVPNGSEKAKHRIEWAKLHKAEIENAYSDYMKKEWDFTDEDVKDVLADTKFIELMNFIRDAMNYINNGATTMRESIDQDATDKAVEQRAKAEGYDKWVDDLLNGIEEKKGIRNNKDYFTSSGNRRSWEALHDEPTLLNIAQIMSAQDNGETFLGSSLKAVAQKQYKNISQIRADKGRLKTISEEEYKALMDGFAERESDIITRIDNASPTYESNPFIRHSDIRSSIVDNVRRGLSKTAFLKDLQKYANTKGATAKDVDDIFDLVRDVANIPTGYFEAKPKRPVTFYEVKALLAPSDAPTDLISRLQDEGVNVVQYEAGNDEDRIAKLNQASDENNLKFSISDDDTLNKYIADRQKRIDDGEQMSFFGSLNETIPSKPKEKTRAEKFSEKAFAVIADIQKKKTWSGREIKDILDEFPEFSFVERLNDKSDETATADFSAFLSSIKTVKDLSDFKWYFSKYDYHSDWKKSRRSGIMKFNKLIDKRSEEILAGKANGRDVGIQKRTYTAKEARDIFNSLNTDKELKALGEKVFDCIDDNFNVRFEGVSNIKGFNFTAGGTQGQAGGRTVHLNMKFFNSGAFTDQQKAETLLHESIHTITVYALSIHSKSPNSPLLNQSMHQACESLNMVYKQIKNDPAFEGEYGKTDVYEMVAELSNPVFRAKLKAKNLFDKILDAIRKLLYIQPTSKKKTAFDMVDEALQVMVETADSVSFDKYAHNISVWSNGKFSVSEEDENAPTPKQYQSTIAKLEDKVADLKSEFKRTDLKTPDPKQTRIQAGRLLKRHDSSNLLHGEVVDTFNKIHRLYKGKGMGAFDEVAQVANDMATRIVDNMYYIRDENEDAKETVNSIKDYIRNNPIVVTPEMKRNITDWGAFYKRNFGRIKMVNGEHTNLDRYYYQNLEKIDPEFFGEYYNTPAEMLTHIEDVFGKYDDILNQNYEMSTEEMREYIAEIASDIMVTAYDLQTKRTFADKKYEEKVKAVKKAREEALASRDRALEQQRQRFEEKIEAYKKYHKDYKVETKERAEKKRRLTQIAGIHKRLLEKLQEPKDTKHLPDGYAPIVSNVLSMFDFTTSRMEKWAERYGEPSKRYRYLDELRKRLEKMSKPDSEETDFGIEVDPDLIEIIEELKADIGEDVRLSDLDSATLEDIYTLFKAFEHQINSYNKAFDERNRQTVLENRDEFLNQMRSRKDRKERQGVTGWLQRQLETNNTTPEDFFHLVGGTPEKLYRSIRKGFDKHIMNVADAMTFIGDTVSGKEAQKWSENVRTYTTSLGDSIKLTDAQLMSIYCLSKREQAQQHMFSEKGGKGIVVAPQKVGKGLKAEEIDRAKVVVSSSDIQKWISQLSDKQREVADQFQKYLSDDMSKLGNETALKLYGYRKFTEKNYFPIQSSENWLNSTFDFSGGDAVLKNVGMTKAVNKFANNPIVIDDIFTVASKHISTMSLYNSLVPPLTDFQRFWNSKDNDHNTTVKQEFERVYGKPALQYVENFMRDLNGSYKRGFEVEGIDKLMSKYKQASIGLNLRVLFQQPTAIARAGAVMNPVYITKALGASATTLKDNLRDMREHCPIALWKSWGFYNTDLARDMKSIIMDESKFSDNFSKAYGVADDLTWSVIFKAVRYEVEAQNKNLKVGSDEYWEKVNERASEVFDRTQVVDSPFHRSQNMRAKDNLSKMVTAFMAEPTKTYNMLKTELTLAKREIESGQKGAGVKRASRVVQVFVTNAILVSASSAVIDALRGVGGSGDDDKDKNWFERFLAHWWSNTKENINPLGLLPLFKDVMSVVQGYDITRMDMQALGRMVKSLQYMGEYIKDPESSKFTLKNEVDYFLQQSAYLVGIPYANIRRDVRGIAFSIAEAVGYDDLFFEEAKFKYQLNEKTKSKNQSIFAEMYINAMSKGNTELADKIKKYMTEHGVDESYITGKAEDYTRENPTEAQTNSYQRSLNFLEGNSLWYNNKDSAYIEDYDKDLRDIALGISTSNTERLQKLESVGISPEENVLIRLAMEKADKLYGDKNGSLNKSEKERALDMVRASLKLTETQKKAIMDTSFSFNKKS